jgi:hypothetical protein
VISQYEGRVIVGWYPSPNAVNYSNVTSNVINVENMSPVQHDVRKTLYYCSSSDGSITGNDDFEVVVLAL